MKPPANIQIDPSLAHNAEEWAAWISASLPTFQNSEVNFDIAHETIVEWVQLIIDTIVNGPTND